MDIALWSDERCPGDYVTAVVHALRRVGHTLTQFESTEATGQSCERGLQRDRRTTAVLIAVGDLGDSPDYMAVRSRAVIDLVIGGNWPSGLNYVVTVLDQAVGMTETVTATFGEEVSWGLGVTENSSALGASVLASVTSLLDVIDETDGDVRSDGTDLLLPPGALLRGASGSFRVQRLAGRGGTAEVYEVLSASGATCAAKLLSGHRFAITAEMQKRFAREIQLLRAIDHEHVLPVVDEATYAGAPVLITEFIGDSVYRHVSRREPADTQLLLTWAEGSLAALEALHSAGIVHRDVSPKNLLIRPNGDIVLADFGTARNVRDETITQPREPLGSLLYVSRQQLESAHGARSADDIFSLGQVLWEAAAARRPHGSIPSLVVTRPDLPQPLAGLVDEMRADELSDRPTALEGLRRVSAIRRQHEAAHIHSSPPLTRSEQVSEEVARRMADARRDDEQSFDGVADEPAADVVRTALVRAMHLGVVSRRMPRVPLSGTEWWIRFVPTASLAASRSLDTEGAQVGLRVDVEHEGGEVVHSLKWAANESAVDLGVQLGSWLVDIDGYPGDIAFQPGRMFDDLRKLLRGAHERITGARGLTTDLAPVVQLCGDGTYGDQWWITDEGVQRDSRTFMYTIAKERFDEPDWDEHVTSKPDVDRMAFRQAFETATAMVRNGVL